MTEISMDTTLQRGHQWHAVGYETMKWLAFFELSIVLSITMCAYHILHRTKLPRPSPFVLA